jgi:hypothetical protein
MSAKRAPPAAATYLPPMNRLVSILTPDLSNDMPLIAIGQTRLNFLEFHPQDN